MKKLFILFSVVLAVVSSTYAQDFDVPKTGAKIYLSQPTFEIKSGEELTFDLWVVRSKKASKSNFDQPKFLGSDELNFIITSDASAPDNYKVTVKAHDVKPGEYFYTVSSRSRSTQKVKGTTVAFKVGATGTVVASDDN